MDGIIVDLLGSWLKDYNEQWNDSLSVEDITTWGVHEHVKPECGLDVYKIIEAPGYFLNLKPLPGAVEGIKMLDKRHDVYLCSAPAGPDSAKEKLLWAEEHLGFDRRQVILCHSKEIVETDVIIDDKPTTLENFIDKGRTAMTIPYPYNQGITEAVYCGQHWDTQVSWAQIVNYLK